MCNLCEGSGDNDLEGSKVGLIEAVKTAIAWLGAEEISREEIRQLLQEALR